MADLIDRAALLKIIRAEALNAMELNANRHHPSALAFGHCHSLVKRAPAVDAVEVVRCRDCKQWEAYKAFPEIGECYLLGETRTGSEYCSRGERKET